MSMKEALDRLRRYDGQSKLTSHLDALDAVYPGTEFGYALSAYTTDLHKAADELLRLTDPTPIDSGWLKAFCEPHGFGWCCNEDNDLILERSKAGWLVVFGDMIEWLPITTRGELRSLAQLLKIELKEQT